MQLFNINTFKQIHDPTLMSTCPIPCLESSPTPSHMPKPNVRKIQFSKQKVFVLEKVLPSFSKIYWTTLRVELLGNSSKQSWVRLRDELLDNSPMKFFPEFPFTTISVCFIFFHVMHSHLSFLGASVHMECIMPFPNNSS